MILRRLIPGLCLVAVLSTIAGCERSRPPEYDLVEAFAVAETAAERPLLDFGTPEARDRLVSGWGHDESAGDTTFVWGLGEQSELRWYLSRPMHLIMFLRGFPLVESPKVQSATVIVNGHPVKSIELVPAMHGYVLPLAAESFVAGWNRIVLRYAFHRQPTPTAPRPLAVAWDFIELRHPWSGYELPSVKEVGAEPSLVLPSGSQIDFFLPLSAGTRLEIERIVWPDGTEAKPDEAPFEVELEAEGAPARVVSLPNHADSDDPWRWPLDVSSASATRLSFRLPNGSPGDGRALTLVRPRLRADVSVGIPFLTPDERNGKRGGARPNVILYLVDTLRADHLGCYGYGRDTSPHLDRFAADAVLFTRTVAQSSWTRASVASIFTGLRPQRHGANRREDALSSAATTLAQLMRAHGYETAAIITNGNVPPQLGFAKGFESYKMLRREGGQPVPSSDVTEHALELLKAKRDERPLFLYLHTIDPHSPYDPPEPYRTRFAPDVSDRDVGSIPMLRGLQKSRLEPNVDETIRRQLVDLYDGDIAANDASFGAFLEGLEALGLYEDTLVIFVSDHGEEFFDHGWWEHGSTLYDEQLLVPLLIKFPKRRMAGRRTDVVASHVDLLPTILASVGAAIPHGIDGRSLLPYLDGEIGGRGPAISYLDLDGHKAESIVLDGRKLIRNLEDKQFLPRPALELYDLERDPQERSNLAFERRVTAGNLQTLLLTTALKGESVLSAQAAQLPDHVKEQLRALGYSP